MRFLGRVIARSVFARSVIECVVLDGSVIECRGHVTSGVQCVLIEISEILEITQNAIFFNWDGE